MRRAALIALVLVGGCVLPAEVAVPGPSAMPAPDVATAGRASDQVVLVAEAGDNDGCFGGDLAAYSAGGTLLRRLAVPAVGGGVISTTESAAFYPTTVVEGTKWRTVIEKVDLRTAATVLRIDAGTGTFGNGLYGRPRCHTVIDVSPDGATLALARPGVEGVPGRALIDLFDARNGQRLATRTFDARAGSADVSLRVLARDRVFVTLESYGGCGGGTCSSDLGVDHLLLDGRLAEIDRSEFRCGRAQPTTAGTSIALCGSVLRSFDSDGRPRRDVALPLKAGEYFLGWRTTDEGAVLVTQWQVIRVDAGDLRLRDARPIAHMRTFRLPFGPLVALAKMAPPRPAVQITADGRVAYAVPWIAGAPWRPGISVIDTGSASVRATYLSDREIWGIELSMDGSRLFVLAGTGYSGGASELLVLDTADGTILSTIKLEKLALALIGTAP